MNRIRKETLKEKIEMLDAQEHAQLFTIVKRYTDSYTKTQSGVLVSSDSLSDECLYELERMVMYFLDQRKRMEADALERRPR